MDTITVAASTLEAWTIGGTQTFSSGPVSGTAAGNFFSVSASLVASSVGCECCVPVWKTSCELKALTRRPSGAPSLSACNSMRTSTSQQRPCLSVSPSRLFQGKALHLESRASEPNVWRRMSWQLLGCLARHHFGNCLLLHASTCMAVLMPCRSWHAIVGSSQTPRSMTVPRSSRSQRFLSTCNDSL